MVNSYAKYFYFVCIALLYITSAKKPPEGGLMGGEVGAQFVEGDAVGAAGGADCAGADCGTAMMMGCG